MLRKSLITGALLAAFVIFQSSAVNAQTTEAANKFEKAWDWVEKGFTAIGVTELIVTGYETAKEYFSNHSEPPETVKPEPPQKPEPPETVKPEPPERPERPYRGGYEPD